MIWVNVNLPPESSAAAWKGMSFLLLGRRKNTDRTFNREGAGAWSWDDRREVAKAQD